VKKKRYMKLVQAMKRVCGPQTDTHLRILFSPKGSPEGGNLPSLVFPVWVRILRPVAIPAHGAVPAQWHSSLTDYI
jgi:hypothetical protein